MPLVSVVIPAFRSASFIAETLDSVLTQQFDDFEVVVADHSSGDGTQEVIDRFLDHPKVRVLAPTPAGGGAQANWNRVSQAADGEYIKLLPADDLLTRDALQKQARALDQNPSAVMVASKRSMIDAQGRVLFASRGLPASLIGHHSSSEAIRATVRSGTNVFGEPGAVMLRRDALERAGWWDGLHGYAIDLQSYANALAFGDVVGLNEVLSSFRVSDQQWSFRLAKSQSAEMARVFRRFQLEWPEISDRDVYIGTQKAKIQAMGRRGVYTLLSLRQAVAGAS